jgi:hypothetical protein
MKRRGVTKGQARRRRRAIDEPAVACATPGLAECRHVYVSRDHRLENCIAIVTRSSLLAAAETLSLSFKSQGSERPRYKAESVESGIDWGEEGRGGESS